MHTASAVVSFTIIIVYKTPPPVLYCQTANRAVLHVITCVGVKLLLVENDSKSRYTYMYIHM